MTEPVTWLSVVVSVVQGTTAVPKAIAKLIDTLGEQTGLLAEPYHIRRRGKAEDDVAIGQAETKAKIELIEWKGKMALRDAQERAEESARKKLARRQRNTELIAAKAADELRSRTVSDDPVDEDWTAQFLNNSQDVSNEQMQTVWAKILAGEVEKPGSFSLRTLASVRTMSKDDADRFTHFCSMVWMTTTGPVAIVPDWTRKDLLAEMQLSFADFVHLDAIGLIKFSPPLAMSITLDVPSVSLTYFGQTHVLSIQGAEDPTGRQRWNLMTGHAMLTDVGRELSVIAGAVRNEGYRISVIEALHNNGWQVVEDTHSGTI